MAALTDPIFEIAIHKSLGGRSSKQQWANLYHVSTPDEIDSDNMQAIVAAIVAAEKTAHLTEVHFMRAHWKQKADNLVNAPADTFVTRELDGTGARQVNFISIPVIGADPVYENPMAPLDTCIEISRSCSFGRAGRLFYRGCLLVDDIQAGTADAFTLKVPTIFSSLGGGTDVLVDMLNTPLPSGVFCIPSKAGLILQPSRQVIAHALAGVTVLKRRRTRTSTDQALVQATRRELRKLIREAKKLLGGGVAGDLAGAAATAFGLLAGNASALMLGVGPSVDVYVLEAAEATALALL